MVVLCVFGSLKNEFGGIFIDILLYELIIYMGGMDSYVHFRQTKCSNKIVYKFHSVLFYFCHNVKAHEHTATLFTVFVFHNHHSLTNVENYMASTLVRYSC